MYSVIWSNPLSAGVPGEPDSARLQLTEQGALDSDLCRATCLLIPLLQSIY